MSLLFVLQNVNIILRRISFIVLAVNLLNNLLKSVKNKPSDLR